MADSAAAAAATFGGQDGAPSGGGAPDSPGNSPTSLRMMSVPADVHRVMELLPPDYLRSTQVGARTINASLRR